MQQFPFYRFSYFTELDYSFIIEIFNKNAFYRPAALSFQAEKIEIWDEK